MHCSLSEKYLGRATTDSGLENLEREALNDIRTLFQRPIEYGVRTEDLNDIRYRISNQDPLFLFLRNPLTGGGRFIEGTKRVYILNHAEWIANPRLTETPAYIGRYLYGPAVILLHHSLDSWCRNVLIHETLHSVSLYSRIWDSFPDIVMRHDALIEGINECLTGYVLLKKRPECYSVWKLDSPGNCRIGYRGRTRLFCSLAQIIGISPMVSFYLSSETSFNSPWNQFIESIRSIGPNQFSYALNESTVFRESDFREECVRSFPGFKKIYDSLAKSLDFSRIP